LPKFEVRASTDLITWQLLSNTLSLTNGAVWFTDPSAKNSPQRFYRVIEKP